MDAPSPSTPPRSRDAFARFYREHFALAWRALLRLGVGPSACDDAVQEVFVAAWRRWDHFDGAVHRRVWLLGFTRRIAWRVRRTETRRDRRHRAIADQPAPAGADPHEQAARRQAWAALAAFLDGLDPEKREAFVLGELEELGRVELGVALGVNPNTAYSRLQAARSRFARHFQRLDRRELALLVARAEAASAPTPARSHRAWLAVSAAIGRAPTTATIVGLASCTAAALTVATGLTFGGARHTAVHPPTPVPAIEAPVAPGLPASILPQPARDADAAARPPVEPVEPTRRAATPRRREATPATPGDPLRDALQRELDLLTAAREAVVHHDWTRARALLDDHRRRFGERSALAELRGEIDRDLANAMISPAGAGDSKGKESQRD